jgi:serine/threonine-protein kinase
MQELKAALNKAIEQFTTGSASVLRTQTRALKRASKFIRGHPVGVVLALLLIVFAVEFNSIQNWVSTIRITRQAAPLLDPATTPASALSSTEWTIQAQKWLERYDRAGNIDRAIDASKRAIERNSANAMAYALLAESYNLKNGTTPDPQWLRLGTESARKAVELNPQLAAAHLAQGIIYLATRQTDAAKRELERARELNPINPETSMWLAECFKEDDKLRAEDLYRHAIQLNTAYWPAYGRYGTFLFKESRYSEAVTIWNQGRVQTPDNVIILKNLGAGYHSLDRYEEAAATFQRALELQPTAAVYSNLGTAQFFQGHYDDAAAAFEEAVKLNATSYLYWANLGDARKWAPGQSSKAVEAYQQAIRIALETLMSAPDDPDLVSFLAVYSAKAGDRKGAIDFLMRLEELPKRTSGSYFKAVIAYELTGNRPKALKALEMAIETHYSLREIKNEPELTSLRTDRRFKEILAR